MPQVRCKRKMEGYYLTNLIDKYGRPIYIERFWISKYKRYSWDIRYVYKGLKTKREAMQYLQGIMDGYDGECLIDYEDNESNKLTFIK